MKTEGRFTLIEMLMVIAVIGILAAMLLPAISKAHQMGLQVQCLNNEKQIGAAMQMYVQDNKLYCLPGYNKNVYEHGGTNWTRYIYKYLQETQCLACPTSPDGPPKETTEGFHLYDGNYGWNFDGMNGTRGTLYAHVTNPSKGYWFFDSGDQCLTVGLNTWDNMMEELDLDWDSRLEGPNRHQNRLLIFYVDGHAEQRGLKSFLACPNKSNEYPWYVEWEEGELKEGTILYPNRH